jgi:hypothetical protein
MMLNRVVFGFVLIGQQDIAIFHAMPAEIDLYGQKKQHIFQEAAPPDAVVKHC